MKILIDDVKIYIIIFSLPAQAMRCIRQVVELVELADGGKTGEIPYN